MTATVSSRRRPRIVTIFLYTLQSCLPPKRWFALLLPCAGALMFGLIARAIDLSREQAFGRVATEGLFSLIVPIAALIIGDAILGAEIRSGTFHFTWLSPTPTWQIVFGRWAAGSFVALITIAPACALAAVVAGTPQTADAAFVAAALGSAAYIAIFLLIGCITRRTAIWALAFVFLIERLLGEALTGIAQLSPTWLSRSIFVAYLDDRPDSLIREGIPYGAGAIGRLAIVTIIVLLLANWRMHHMRLSGASD
jgi:ABC-type transport system involved in multi-copper enzyme maturation permease subunit